MEEEKKKTKIVYADRVNIKAKNARHMKDGEVYSVHPVIAKKLIRKGVAEKVK